MRREQLNRERSESNHPSDDSFAPALSPPPGQVWSQTISRCRSQLALWLDKPLVIVTLITALGAALRLYHIGYKSLWFDEAVMYWVSAGSLESVLTENARLNSAPPVFALMLWAVINVATSEAALRALSWLAGVAALPMLYLLSRRLTSTRAAYVAPTLAALSVEQIFYSQQVREYSLAFLLAIVLLWSFVRYAQRPQRSSAVALGAAFVAAILVQYGLVLLIVALNIIWIAVLARARFKRAELMHFVAVNAVAFAAVILIYFVSLRAHFDSEGRGAEYLAQGYWNGAVPALPGLAVGNTLDIVAFAYPGALFLFVWLLGVAAAARSRRWLVLALLIAPMAVTLFAAIARAYPYVAHRHTIFLAPMIYVMAALGIHHLSTLSSSRLAPSLLFVLLVATGLRETMGHLRDSGSEHLRPLVATVLAKASADEMIYVSYGARPAFAYYARDVDRGWIGRRWGIESPSEADKELGPLAEALRTGKRVWLVLSRDSPAERQEVLALTAGRKASVVREEKGATLFVAP